MDSEKNTAAGRKSLLRRHAKLTLRYVRTFVLWAAAGLVIGALGGLIGTAFCYAIREATQLRGAYPWLLYFLPAGGLLIVWLYRLRGMHPTDTNGVLLAIHAPTSIPGSTAPLSFVGPTITHLCGGGPVGVDNLAAAIGEARDTIEDVLEPFLIQQGFLQRTPRGRVATAAIYRHLGLDAPSSKNQSELWQTP